MKFSPLVLAAALLGALSASSFAASFPEITVYKSAYCGCCKAWVEYLEKEGFKVKAIETEDRSAQQKKAGLLEDQGSCHTAFVDGYALEGHVPVGAIKKMLTEHPHIKGLTVPGMPANSPGMGPLNGKLQTLEIGTKNVFSTD